MKRLVRLKLVFAIICLGFSSASADWRAFRGSDSNSAAPGEKIPVTWNVEPGKQKNLAWQIDLPGRGLSSPIVVGDKVIVTCSDGHQNTRIHVLAFDTGTGKKLWHRTAWATGRTFCHPTTANAAPTPVSDGEAVYAFFSSNDLVCIDLEGNFRWFRGLAHDYPKAGNDVGMASSPIVAGNTVVVQVENQGDSFVAGIDKNTGETRWRLQRPHSANWTSPILLRDPSGGAPAVLLQSRSGLVAVVPDTGRELWRFDEGCSSMSSPVVDPDRKLILVPAGGILALKFNAADQVPAEHWRTNQLRLSTVSPVLSAGRVFTIKSPAILVCGDVETGEVLWQLRLKEKIWSTPVIAGDHLYAINRDGLAQVVKLGPEQGEIVATYDFGKGIDATPAISEGAYYVRCNQHLWKIAAP